MGMLLFLAANLLGTKFWRNESEEVDTRFLLSVPTRENERTQPAGDGR